MIVYIISSETDNHLILTTVDAVVDIAKREGATVNRWDTDEADNCFITLEPRSEP
jgi:hypothetical protein